MSTYSVQFGPMSEATEGLAAVYQRLTQIGDDLKQMVQSGTVDFHGNTKDNFMIAQAKYDQAHADLSQSLNAATSVLGGIHEDYVGAEHKGTGLWAH